MPAMDSAARFLKLEDYLLPPPLPALVALLITLGIAHLGWRLARALRGQEAGALDVTAGFLVLAGATGALVHGLALAQLARVSLLRPAGWALAAMGAYEVAVFGRRRALRFKAAWREWWADLGTWERAGMVVSATAALGLFLAALGPPTDADSLAYHLGVPLDWLRHGGAYRRSDWFLPRLVGLGESFNLLGLAAGTDVLGAALSAGGGVAAFAAVSAVASSAQARSLAALFVASCPAMGFLVPNQKPQLLPAAATTAAVMLVWRRWESFDGRTALLTFGSIALAIGAKYPFAVTGGLAGILALVAARRSGHLRAAVLTAAGAVLLLSGPVLARNWLWYGDPWSPLLERLRAHPDPALVRWVAPLISQGQGSWAEQLALFPLNVLVPTTPGAATAVLGLGALAWLSAGRVAPRGRAILFAAGIATGLFLAAKEFQPRYYLEPYLWCAAVAVASSGNGLRPWLAKALVIQSGFMVVVAWVGAASLFPGAWSSHLRAEVMTRAGLGYAEARWLDAVLPREAVLMSANRAYALSPRPFVATDRTHWASDDEATATLAKLVLDYRVTAFTIYGSGAPSYLELQQACGEVLAGPVQLPLATRNPFNREVYEATVLAVRRHDPTCMAALLRLAEPASQGSNLDVPSGVQ